MPLSKSKGSALIVDDEEEVCETLESYLKNLGQFKMILTAKDGAQALTKLQNQKFDLILLDVRIPRRNGIEVAQFIEEISKDKTKSSIKNVLLVTGVLNKEILADAMKLGIKHYIVKPFDEASFQKKVISLLKELREPAAA